MKKNIIQVACGIFIILQVFTLSACGSGGGSSGGSTPNTPSTPSSPNNPNNNNPAVNNPTVKITPANNEANVPFRPIIQLQFSEAVQDVSSSTVGLYEDNNGQLGQSVPISDVIDAESNTYTFMPKYALNANVKYDVVVNGVTTVAGNNPIINTTSSFTTMANHYAYVTSYTESTLSVCIVNPADGSMSNCSQTGSGFSKAYGVAVAPNDRYVYVANSNGNISICSVNQNEGTLNNCTTYKDSAIPEAYGLTIDPAGNNLYIATLGNSQVAKCSINKTDGSLSNCTTLNFNADVSYVTYGITINNTGKVAFITSTQNNAIFWCNINKDGTFATPCSSQMNVITFKGVTGVAVDQNSNYLYLARQGQPTVQSCAISQETQNTICTATGFGFDNQADIKLDQYSNFAYVTNNSVNTVSICKVQYGNLNNCQAAQTANATKINFNTPEMVAIY